MSTGNNAAREYKKRIQGSELTIYDPIKVGDEKLWIPSSELQVLLENGLKGQSLAGLSLRTRSKAVKSLACTSLGYPIPKSFQKTQPRFPGQCFDTYVQKSNNLQIWNEELSPTRRYAIIRVNEKDVITAVRVVDGQTLSLLDKTGTLTQKYQARVGELQGIHELVSNTDTEHMEAILKGCSASPSPKDSPVDYPSPDSLMPIGVIFEKLKTIVGGAFKDLGRDQDRNRGGHLHRLVCEVLGYEKYRDNGRFPDVRHQLLEVKLQTSPTINLGLVTPDSKEPLDIPMIGKTQIRHCDVRYAIFYASIQEATVRINNLILTPGENFFGRFARFEGKVVNKKLQIPLPGDFFGGDAE